MSQGMALLQRSRLGLGRLAGLMVLVASALPLVATAADLAAGRRLYDQHCASCHGFDGKSRYPDVPDLRFSSQGGLPGFDAVNKLKMGSARKPPFLGRLTDQQLMDTLVYARTLK